MNVLFVTWDGPQVFYLESLFLPIFQDLAEFGWRFHVLQFSWGGAERISRTREACASSGVPYRAIRVWRRPVSVGPIFTAFKGALDIKKAVSDWKIDVLMPRSNLPLLGCLKVCSADLPLVFDADGLPLDERVEFHGMSATGLAHRFLRDLEAQGVRRANIVLTRSKRASEILLARGGACIPPDRFYEVTNGRDADLFTPGSAQARRRVRERLSVAESAPLLVYAGSLGGKYQLSRMLLLFSKVRTLRPDARLLVLTGSPEIADQTIKQFPAVTAAVVTLTVPPELVSRYLAAADVGLAMIEPTFSMQAVSAIKLGEYLLCGLPVVATEGVGDTSHITPKIGFVTKAVNQDVLDKVAAWVVDEVLPERENFRSRCRQAGVEHYSLGSSVQTYHEALQRVFCKGAAL